MTFRRVKRRLPLNFVGAELFAGRPKWTYSFNGTDQYATFPTWAAQGKPRGYNFSFIADAVATGAEQVILGGTGGAVELAFYLHATLPTLTVHYKNDTGTQAIEGLLDFTIEAGVKYDVAVQNLGTGSTITVNGVQQDLTAFAASAGIQPDLTHIGAGPAPDRYFGGVIKAAYLRDSSPIQDTDALMGDGTRYIEISQFTIPVGDDLSIAWDGIVQASICWVSTDVAGTSGIRVSQSNIQIFNNGIGEVIANTSLAVGQHYRGKLDVLSGVATIYVDGVVAATGAQALDSWNMGLVTGSTTQQMSAGQAFQNVTLENLTTGEAIGYKINEGSGLDVIAYDMVGGEFGAPKGDGPEEVVNGDFSGTDLSQWSSFNTGAYEIVSGQLQVTSQSAVNDGAFITVPAKIGAIYRLRYSGFMGTAGVVDSRVSNPSAPGSTMDDTSGNTTYLYATTDFTKDVYVQAQEGGICVTIQPRGVGDTCFADNISIYEVAPGGTITPDADWQYIPENSRSYPINEGEGSNLECYDGNTVRQPTLDATIQNYTDNWEE